MWLFIGSWTFSSVFSYLGGHEVFEHFFKSMDLAPWQFLVITQIIIFLLGWPLKCTEILEALEDTSAAEEVKGTKKSNKSKIPKKPKKKKKKSKIPKFKKKKSE